MYSNPKQQIWRSEQHRRNVASLPCVVCRREGRTQAAHLGGLADGKGRGLKVPDTHLAALCGDGPLTRGCHTLFDLHETDWDPWMLIARTYFMLMERDLIKVMKP
jgi:hypothetical protein